MKTGEGARTLSCLSGVIYQAQRFPPQSAPAAAAVESEWQAEEGARVPRQRPGSAPLPRGRKPPAATWALCWGLGRGARGGTFLFDAFHFF